MKVHIYVEGPSDQRAMETLLGPLIMQKEECDGINILFHPVTEGDHKKTLVTTIPVTAVEIIRNEPDAYVVVLPDLYPQNKGFAHNTVDELITGTIGNFNRALQRKRLSDDTRLKERFKVFCFKHDLEALLLAAEDGLKQRLGIRKLTRSWKLPVEEQNHGHPPKRIVEELFAEQKQSYRDTLDAPGVLSFARYQDICEACPQCFKPFVDFLTNLAID